MCLCNVERSMTWSIWVIAAQTLRILDFPLSFVTLAESNNTFGLSGFHAGSRFFRHKGQLYGFQKAGAR